jgi:hypothetical protein
MLKWAMAGAAAILLSACASSDKSLGVQVSSKAATTYPPVAPSACRISSHPPQGQYVVIASLSTAQRINETPSHLLNRLQKQGAAMGADYVMVTSVSDKKYISDQYIDNNTYLDPEAQFFDTAQPAAVGYNNVNGVGTSTPMEEIVTAQALKITSGSNKPNKKAPSNLSQLR